MDELKIIIKHHKMQMMLRMQIIDSMKEELKAFESLAAKDPMEHATCLALSQSIKGEEKILRDGWVPYEKYVEVD